MGLRKEGKTLIILWLANSNEIRFTKHSRHQELENNSVQLNELNPNEVGFFGVRAAEKDFYNGITQSRPTTAAGSFSNSVGDCTLYEVNNMSGTTLGTPSFSAPPLKRLTLGFGLLPISQFDPIEPSSQWKSLPVFGKNPGEAFANQSFQDDSTVIQGELPTFPQPATLPKKYNFSDNIDQELNKRKRADGALATFFAPLTSNNSTFKPWSEFDRPMRGNEPEDTLEGTDSSLGDSLSIHSDDDPFPNKLSSASRPTKKRQSTDSNTLPNFELSFPPIIMRSPANTLDKKSSKSFERTFNSVKSKHSINATPRGKTIGIEVKQQKDIRHATLGLHHRNRNDSVEEFDRQSESPFSDKQALESAVTTRRRSSSTISFNQRAGALNRSQSTLQLDQGYLNDRLSTADASGSSSTGSIPTILVERFRSNSESSMGSISDLYEAYTKKSIMIAELSKSNEIGLLDLHSRTEYEQTEYEKAEKEKNRFLSAHAAVIVGKSPPSHLRPNSKLPKTI